MEINVKQIFEHTLADAGILTGSKDFLPLDEAIVVGDQSDVVKYTKSCDTIISNLIKHAGALAAKLRSQPLSTQELELVKTIFTNTSAARSYIIFASKTKEIIRAEEAITQAVQLLNKSNFKGL
jgi:hypothetical protein